MMNKYDQMMSQTKLSEGGGGDYFDPPVGQHVVEIVSVEEKQTKAKEGKPPIDYIGFTLRMLAPEFNAAIFTRPFFIYPDNVAQCLEWLGDALHACGIWSENQPLSASVMMFPSLQGKRLQINVVKRKSDPTKVNVYFNKLVTLNAPQQQAPQQAPHQQPYQQQAPQQTQQPYQQQQAPQGDGFGGGFDTGFAGGSEPAPF